MSRGPALHAAALTYLEPAPVLRIDEYGGRYYDPGDGHNVGIGTGYADLTAPAGAWCVGLFYRVDYRGAASRDTLDALVSNHAGQPFDVGRNYALWFESMYLEAAGLKVSRVFAGEPSPGWSLQFGITGSLMGAFTDWDEQLRGSATATSGNYAVGTATFLRARSDYDQSDFNPFVERADPEGYGYSADVAVVLRSPAGLMFELTVMDAYSHVDWRNMPQSLETIDNQTIRYDANFNREAFIRGQDRRVDLEQVLEPRYRAVVSAPLRRGYSVMLSDDYVHHTHFPAVGLRYGWQENYAAVDFDVQTAAVSLMAGWGGFSVSLTADRFQPQQATVLGADLRFTRNW